VSAEKPLAGKRILITRARHQAGQLAAMLRPLGAEAIEIPAIEIVPPESYEPLDAALRNLSQYQWLIVTSANTVRVLAERAGAAGVAVSEFSHLRIAAVGSGTAHALVEMGLRVHVTPPEYVAESLLGALGDEVRGQRVLLARAAIARDLIPNTLRKRGATVDVFDAYRTVVPADSVERMARLFSGEEPALDAATFTSSSTVTNFFHLLRTAGIAGVPAGMKAVSIGPVTSGTLRDYGWEPTAEADPHDLGGLMAAVVRAVS
jgi:uroporphyrinogen-III synthase